MNESLRVETSRRDGGVIVFRLVGRLDSHGAMQLRQQCEQHAAEHGKLVLNLKDVTFLSSSGVGVLVALTETLRENGGAVHLAEVGGTVYATLQLLNLDRHLSIHSSEEEAIRLAA